MQNILKLEISRSGLVLLYILYPFKKHWKKTRRISVHYKVTQVSDFCLLLFGSTFRIVYHKEFRTFKSNQHCIHCHREYSSEYKAEFVQSSSSHYPLHNPWLSFQDYRMCET